MVDDDPDYRELTRLKLEAAGYQVSLAKDGREALTLLEKDYQPDLLILDVNMPDQNGLTTVININVRLEQQQGEKRRRIPIIVATGLQSEKVQEIFMSKQVDDYIKKPYGADELIQKVRRLIDADMPKEGNRS